MRGPPVRDLPPPADCGPTCHVPLPLQMCRVVSRRFASFRVVSRRFARAAFAAERRQHPSPLPSLLADPPTRSVALGCRLTDGVRVGRGCALVHCALAEGSTVGDDAYLYGVTSPPTAAAWPARIAAHEVQLGCGDSAILLRHAADALHSDAASDAASTFLSRPWRDLHEAGATAALLWPSAGGEGGEGGMTGGGVRSLWNAKLFPLLTEEARGSPWGLPSWWRATRWLFRPGGTPDGAEEWTTWPRVSFADCAARVDVRATVRSQHQLARSVALATLAQRLMLPEPQDVRVEVRQLACGERSALDSLLQVTDRYTSLHTVTYRCIRLHTVTYRYIHLAVPQTLDGLASRSPPQMAARAFAAVAEALAMRAGKAGGLRSGPACNSEWVGALRPLRAGRVAEATAALAAVRATWLRGEEPRMLVRVTCRYIPLPTVTYRYIP